VAAWQAGRLLAPLRTLREAAQEISESDLSRRIAETGNDDITALTRTFNQMLERLDSAFTGQRQFLDDAGHELKTPLTVLQGHLELLDTTDPTEVAATKELLLDEVDRMSRLVQELIMLAKTDRPDFFRFEPVDLAPYLDTLLEKCRALGPRDWVLDEAVAETAVLDEQRITQALLQLAQNAVKHTDEGDEIGLGAHVDAAGGLRLWVRDSGRGVADDAKEHIFDRFSRDRVRADDEGFGLGLSIVAAIARAHGGVARVDDAPGGGAVFTLTLPLTRKDETWPAS
jgi:signal transduction histidine kinase